MIVIADVLHSGRCLQSSAMRATLRLFSRIRAIPASSIPAGEVRLPPPGYKAAKTTNKGTATIDAAAKQVESSSSDLPSNLRLEEFIPPRQLYAGISEKDRETVSCGIDNVCNLASLTCYAVVPPAQKTRERMIMLLSDL